MKYAETILDLIGDTPLVKLTAICCRYNALSSPLL